MSKFKNVLIIIAFSYILFYTVYWIKSKTQQHNLIKITRPSISIPVIGYHYIKYGKNDIDVFPGNFENQMQYLKDHGYQTILSSDIKKIKNQILTNSSLTNQKYVIITFDDGYQSVYDNAFPIMEKYNYKGIIFLISSYVKTNYSRTFMDIYEINELLKAGWEIGSHTISHVYLDRCSLKDQIKEIHGSKFNLEELFKTKLNAIAYPYGIINDNIIAITSMNYDYGFTTLDGNNEFLTNYYDINRHLIMNDTSMKDFKMMLTSKYINCEINPSIFRSELIVELQLPVQLQITNIKILYNYIEQKNYSINNHKLIFKTRLFHNFDNFTLYFQDTNKNNYYYSKLLNVIYQIDLF